MCCGNLRDAPAGILKEGEDKTDHPTLGDPETVRSPFDPGTPG
jgi:hypothetical protein